MIEVTASTVLYRNPRPEVFARHAWHPSLVRLGAGEWLCSFDVGQGPESHDYATHVSRSQDDGLTWSAPVRLLPLEPAPRATHSVRVGRCAEGTLVGVGPRFLRSDPTLGLIHSPSLGYTEMELVRTVSTDGGLSWSAPEVVPTPVPGPFETCHPPLELVSGQLLWPTSTWMRWDGTTPERMRAVALVSADGGATWPGLVEVLDQWDRGVVSWEQSVTQLDDGRLVAAFWSLDAGSGVTEPTRVVLAASVEAGFGPALDTGIRAQTTKLASLGGDRVLALYRRDDEPGLWASVAQVGAGTWTTVESQPLWRGAGSGMAGATSVGTELSALQFGYPSIVLEPAGTDAAEPRRAAAAFWCTEDGITGIRLLRLRIDSTRMA